MTRYLFVSEPLLNSIAPALLSGGLTSGLVQLSANQPFTLWTDRDGGNKITDCTAPNGQTALGTNSDGSAFLADGSGQPPAMRGPNDGTVLMWIDAGQGRYPLFAVDLLGQVLTAAIGWLTNGTVDYTSDAFTEAVQDAAAKLFTSTQGTGVSVAYDDPNGRLTVTVAGGGSSGLDAEGVQDVFGTMVTQAGGTYNDTAGTVTFPSSGGGTATFDAEAVRDAIGAASSGTGYVTVQANDAADTIVFGSSAALDTALTARLRVDAAQTLTAAQKTQARTNLGLVAYDGDVPAGAAGGTNVTVTVPHNLGTTRRLGEPLLTLNSTGEVVEAGSLTLGATADTMIFGVSPTAGQYHYSTAGVL